MAADRELPEVVAGIDLGSNSFHMIVVRAEADGRVHVLDKLKEPVRLALGLGEDRMIDAEAEGRALEALARFAQRLERLPAAHVRAVGTNTLRQAKNGAEFLKKARAVLGHDVDVISGPEEARLIYLGVAHDSYFEGRRFVMDIGGGSTEVIIGEGFSPIFRDSLYMGCVSFSQRFFGKGRITEKHFRHAEVAAQRELVSVAERYRSMGWDRASGASGTIRAIDAVLRGEGFSPKGITLAGLDQLKAALIDVRRVDRLSFSGLEPDRAPVFAGGVAIARAAFLSLGIEHMEVSDGALREGVAYELLGQRRHGDVRDRTARTFAERYRADLEQAARVEKTALQLFSQLRGPWQMQAHRSEKYLHWAALLHEIGLSVAYAGHHKHASYLVRNSEMPGFSRQQQAMLAALLRNQRRRLRTKALAELSEDRSSLALHLIVVLRLAVALNRGRAGDVPAVVVERASRRHLVLRFPEGWLESHPLTKADLDEEAEWLEEAQIELEVS